ncbi:zinc-finger of a C2HC-type [Carpediemonas membranifera]|uniref:Zinc-finger of a C2HC-type n=1 Tax=Carpediemonas membranifera TaxID=201153 RepID=A0A8J6APW2_9EUKA|nr:zinc-finger of a C2HC-type [Carpediemonas membranifera]|eukprot:KAG9390586.1 zinc-finger of a C2HC-type [Carpediemonas membranifera]
MFGSFSMVEAVEQSESNHTRAQQRMAVSVDGAASASADVPSSLSQLVSKHSWITRRAARPFFSANPHNAPVQRAARRQSAPPSRPSADQFSPNVERGLGSARERKASMPPMPSVAEVEPSRLSVTQSTTAGPNEMPSEYAEITLVPCRFCGKKFAEGRISKHESICGKPSKKRKVFNAREKALNELAQEGVSVGASDKARKVKTVAKPWQKKAPAGAKAGPPSPVRKTGSAARAGPGGPKPRAKGGPPSRLMQAKADERVACDICGRKFDHDRVGKHRDICAASWAKKNNKPIPPKPKSMR